MYLKRAVDSLLHLKQQHLVFLFARKSHMQEPLPLALAATVAGSV